ncbi:MAG: ABC transporter substrate-binding protein [Acidimicrobiia bacterium]|nr:ABC transporter substrate-binding protein [Acidimicrobiia bacterium]
MRKSTLALVAPLTAVALLAAACGSDDSDSSSDDTTADTSADTTGGDSGEASGGGNGYAELEAAQAGEYDGTSVSVIGVWTDNEEENFTGSLASFSEETGIDIAYEGVSDFATLINVRVEAGDAPDIAMFPQPGLLGSFVESGDAIDIGEFITPEDLAENYGEGWIDLATFDDTLAGVFFRASTKSIVWYPVKAWEEAGYEIPETWEELTALQDQIVADGSTPWCISIEDGDNTGWVGTDWVEDVLLRTAPVEVYDQWITHEVAFDDPEVVEALDIVGDIWLNEDYVFGGTTGILSTWIGDTPTPMFAEGGPDCWMHRQAGWIIDFFPEDQQEFGVDAAYFYLPSIEEADYGKPVLGAGDLAGAFDDRPEVRALMQYMSTPEAAEGWAAAGGFISPNSGLSSDAYANEGDAAQAEILVNATTLRFDASDLMPPEVGAGSFWAGIVDWVEGQSAADMLAAVEASWPS